MTALKLTLLCVGKLNRATRYIETVEAEYIKRLRPYCDYRVVALPSEAIRPSRSETQVKAAEGQRLLAHCSDDAVVVAFSPNGRTYSSPGFAKALSERHPALNPINGGSAAASKATMLWIIGGPLGLDAAVLHRADWIVSLSEMTLTHTMTRLLCAEQLYRAFRILHKQPYHK